MKISTDQAQAFIDSYCQDEPKSNAAELLEKSDIELVEQNNTNWVEVADGLGADQDDIDAVIY